jgi:hypothetical protein
MSAGNLSRWAIQRNFSLDGIRIDDTASPLAGIIFLAEVGGFLSRIDIDVALAAAARLK